MRTTIVVLAASVGFILPGATAAAQDVEHKANTKGLYLNGHFNGTSAKYSDPDAKESGGGAGFQIGYGVTRALTLFVGTDASRLSFGTKEILAEDGSFAIAFEDKYWLKQYEIGGRFNFVSPTRTLVPYLEAAYMMPSGGSDFQIFFDDDGNPSTDPRNDDGISGQDPSDGSGAFDLKKGTAFSVGGGLQYFFSQKLALDLELKFSPTKFKQIEINADGGSITDDTETKFNLTRVNFGVVWYPMIGR